MRWRNLLEDKVIKEIESVLGIQGLKIKKSPENNNLESINWNSSHVEISSLKESLEYIKCLINENISDYENEENEIKKSYIVQRIVDTFIYSSILSLEIKEEINNKVLDLKKLIKNLTNLATQTYEQRLCTSSFILIKSKEAEVKDELNKLEIEFIDFREDILNWDEVNKYPAALRLVDSLSLSYVIDSEYKIIGFGRKKNNCKSIKEICLNNTNEMIEYIYLEDKKIHWCLNKNKVFILNNGEWKLKDYSIIKSILKDFIDKNSTENFKKRDENNTISYFLEIIKDLSKNNIGSLFILLGKNYFENEDKVSEFKDFTIINKMVKEETDERNRYAKIIEREKSNLTINKLTLDAYLLKLIADVDGAVIIGKSLEIIGYGKMIKSQKRDDKIIEQLISCYKNQLTEFNDSYSVEGGARSIATYESSTFGLAIKVSEDGGITMYKRRKLIFKL